MSATGTKPGPQLQQLDLVTEAFDQITGKLATVVRLADVQTGARAGVIRVVSSMCDALQLAGDLINGELSSAISEFHRLRGEESEVLNGYFARLAIKCSDANLRLLLHEGRVCSELHAMTDRFRTAFSREGVSALPAWEAIKSIFTRETAMSQVLNSLRLGEMHYLYDFRMLLDDVRSDAEEATRTFDAGQLRAAGDQLVEKMRERRRLLQQQIDRVRNAADGCIARMA